MKKHIIPTYRQYIESNLGQVEDSCDWEMVDGRLTKVLNSFHSNIKMPPYKNTYMRGRVGKRKENLG